MPCCFRCLHVSHSSQKICVTKLYIFVLLEIPNYSSYPNLLIPSAIVAVMVCFVWNTQDSFIANLLHLIHTQRRRKTRKKHRLLPQMSPSPPIPPCWRGRRDFQVSLNLTTLVVRLRLLCHNLSYCLTSLNILLDM